MRGTPGMSPRASFDRLLLAANRPKSVIEDVIGYMSTLTDSGGLVEVPMDPEINSALTIFFFGLRQTRKTARHVGTNVAVGIFGYAIEFVGNERESDLICSVKTAKSFENCTAKPAVARRIRREGRSKVWSIQVTGRRAERSKGRVANCGRIAITGTGGSSAAIGFADRSNGSPKMPR